MTNELRLDLANYYVNSKPAFMRWRGVLFIERINIENIQGLKNCLGLVEKPSGNLVFADKYQVNHYLKILS